ncbi:MAG: hypothetical protein ACI8X5_001259 [Planctomycetota bacterium]
MKSSIRNIRRLRAHPSRRGNLLVVSIVFVMVVASMGMVLLQTHTSQARRQTSATDQKRAMYIAEAGLAEAYMAVAQGKNGNVGTEDLPAVYADGIFWVEATNETENRVGLISTGLCGIGRFALSIVLERQMDPLASLGFYASGDIVVGKGALIDGFDSSIGTLPEQYDLTLRGDTTGAGAQLNAGGDITFEFASGSLNGGTGETVLYGDAHPGPQGVISQADSITITGTTTPLRSAITLSTAETPELTARGSSLPSHPGITIFSGEHKTTIAKVGARNKLRIVGPAMVIFDELHVIAGGDLEIDATNGQVVLYVEDYISIAEGSSITNTSADPTGLVIFANGEEWIDRDGDDIPDDPVSFTPTSAFYGYLYAPNSDITVNSNMHVVGGIACKNLTLEDGARLTFDMALASSEVTATGTPKLIAWRIVSLPDAEIVKTKIDPFIKLAALGITPVKSSDAALDKYIHIKYYDTLGNPQSYEGPVSGLDSTDIRDAILCIWDDDPVIGDEGRTWCVPSTLKLKVGRNATLSR